MRAVLVLMILGCAGAGATGCTVPGSSDPEPWMDPGGPVSFPEGCREDSSCASGQVCARVGGCTAADQIRAVHVNWTLSGKPANATVCDATQSLTLRLAPPDSFGIGWAPVPCSQGKFTVDKIPISYSQVELSQQYHDDTKQDGTLDAVTGEVTIDLRF